MGILATTMALSVLAGPDVTPDVTLAPIPSTPASGKVNGSPFRVNEARIDADGMSTIRLQGVGADRIRPYKIHLRDRRGTGDYREIEIRINADWDRRLDGSTVYWKPCADDSPEDRKQKAMGVGPVRIARGIAKINVAIHDPRLPKSQYETVREQISARIEFGKLEKGVLSGRIILAWPGKTPNWIAGTFAAEYRVRH